MDVQTLPGYFMKVVDDIQNKKNAAVNTNSNINMDSQVVTYLLNIEQADGTCQAIQITEDEARCLGILVNGTTSDNTNSTTNSTETTTNLTNSIENTSLIMQPTKPLNIVVTHEKHTDTGKTSIVDICNNGKLNEKPVDLDMFPYSTTLLKKDGSSEVIQLTDQAALFGMFLNNSENPTASIDSNKTVAANSVEGFTTNVIKHPAKISNKPYARHKKIVRYKKKTDIYNTDNRKQKPTEMNLLSYSPTILQGNSTSKATNKSKFRPFLPTALLSVNHTSPTIPNVVKKTIDVNEKTAKSPGNANTPTVNCLVKYANTAIKSSKHIVNVKNITSNQKQREVDIHCYSATNKNSHEEAPQPFGISNGVKSSVEVSKTSKNVIRNAIEIMNVKPVKHPPRFSHKPVTLCKEMATNAKISNVEVCSSISTEKSIELIQPLGSSENPIEIIKDGEVLHSTQNLSQDYLQQIAEALQFKAIKTEKVEEETTASDESNVIYRVVYPEELDLNPKPKQPKRGRPKKRLLSNCSEEKPELIAEEPKPPKNMRTRSGRITRPPQYIQKDFKKIETSEVDNMETDFKIVEFEPLTTNQPPTVADTPIKINQLENHQRKRSIASQFRCPKCKKAYLGRSKMLKHLQKHPDHGPVPEHCKVKDDETWNFLMDLCNKSPIGQKGVKFCKELVNFLRNVRVLAKMFFRRPTCLDKNLYFVDSSLSNVFGIESGNYVLNESELHTEVSLLSFLNSRCFKGDTESSENSDPKVHNESFDLDAFVETCQTANHDILHENLSFPQNSNQVLNGVDNDFSHKLNSEENKNSKPSSTLEDTNFHESKLSFDTIQNSGDNGFSLNCDITSVSTFNPELQKYDEQILSNFTDRSINANQETKSVGLGIVNSSSEIHEENRHEKSMNPDLSLHSELLSDNSLLTSLPNLRTSVEELMLNNVDSTQVTNLLDNSTGSDEVMNVDQFVNERFKNLTESDLELPNTSLNLDLPSLDLFQFHTS